MMSWKLLVRTGLAVTLVWSASWRAAAEDSRKEEPDAAPASNETKPSDTKPKRPADGKASAPALNARQERQTLKFARDHHPELADLLATLKDSDARQYQKALQELLRTQQRLSKLHEKQAAGYADELALWKVESRIRLLLAQLAMDDDEHLETDLKPLLVQRRELKQAVLSRQRTQVAERLADLDRQLETLTESPEAYADRELARARQSLAKKAKPKKEKNKPKEKA